MANDVVVKVFDETPECPKCGLVDSYSATEPDEPRLKMTYCKAGRSIRESPQELCQGLPFEHLHVSCGRCGYVFLMNTKEHSEAKEKGRRGAHAESTKFQQESRGRRGRVSHWEE